MSVLRFTFLCVETITNYYIATRIVVGVSVALPAASLCINRRLYKIASCQTTSLTPAHVSTALKCLVAPNLIFSVETPCCYDRPRNWAGDTRVADGIAYVLHLMCPKFLLTSLSEEFIVQGHRYDIWEEVGCYPDTVNTPPAYPLSFLWPIIISIVSSTYCGMLIFCRSRIYV